MRKIRESLLTYKNRRQKLESLMNEGEILILSSPTEFIRNGSVGFPFRQDSNLYYLTGFEEPGSILVFRPHKKPQTILFVNDKDSTREMWDGFRFGPSHAQTEFQMDAVFSISQFEVEIQKLLKDSQLLYYRLYRNLDIDKKIESVLKNYKISLGRTGFGLLTIKDSDELMGHARKIKTKEDIENLKRACEISAEAHLEIMKYIKPGMNEREIHGYFIYQAMKKGADREGYNGIVAGGGAATTLHYVFNDQPLKENELLLIDCGAEFNFFTGDITRTYPINGRFTETQAEVYSAVLKVQKEIIAMVKPGVVFQQFHDTANSLLAEAMLDLGIVSGRKDDVMSSLQHRKYYPHGIGHYLGLDVHDQGLYFTKDMKPLEIEEDMVFTIEPGIYVPKDDMTVPEKYRGIGVRIEDNIRVTSTGHEVFTTKAPKEIAELETIIGSAYK
jgi:Xaa-Pro aminopeptidase